MSGYTWLDKLTALPPFFTTSHYMFSISTGSLVVELRPRLQSVMNTVQGNCIYTIHSQCIRLKEMAQRHLEVRKCLLCTYTVALLLLIIIVKINV